jgi:WS/DGAT/MGAT family acyltransferase
LSALDAAFLAIESEHAPMHVGWAALFRPPPDRPAPTFEEIREHISRRLHRAPRYRQRLADVPLGLGDPVWVDDAAFDVCEHVLRCDFGALVDEVMSAPPTPDRALWQLWIATLDDGNIGVAGKAHHCLVDGLAAVELMALLLDATPDPPKPGSDDGGWTARALPSAVTLVADAVSDRADKALALARLPLGWLHDPRSLRDVPAHVAQAVVHTAQPLAPPSSMNGAMTSMRHLARVSRPFDDLRTIKRRFGTTVNDVLLSASAGALRSLHVQRAEDPHDVAMRERTREGEPQGADACSTRCPSRPVASGERRRRSSPARGCRTSRSRTSPARTCRFTSWAARCSAPIRSCRSPTATASRSG